MKLTEASPDLPTHPNPPSTENATAACLLTPEGEGGISVIEVTGPEAARAVDTLFVNPRGHRASEMTPGRLLYGKLVRGGEMLDEIVLECAEVGPTQTYAINCHGGLIASRRVLTALAAEGVPRVSPAELLARRQRAGVLDRIRREAAERLPDAPTLLAARVVLDQYHGALSAAAASLRRRATEEPDWPALRRDIESLLRTARFGRALFECPRVVIAGRPNVGKSTLANALLRFDRMIVHPAPGTTRDTVEDFLAIGGVPFLLVDTAGIRDALCAIEQEGVQRGREEFVRAHIVVLVLDGSGPLQRDDVALLDAIHAPEIVVAVNKSELPQRISVADLPQRFRDTALHVSAAEGTGIESLEQRILDASCPERPASGQPVVFTERQERRLREALDAVVSQSLDGLAQSLGHLFNEVS